MDQQLVEEETEIASVLLCRRETRILWTFSFLHFFIDLTGGVLGLAERVEEGYQTRFLQYLDDFAFWWLP